MKIKSLFSRIFIPVLAVSLGLGAMAQQPKKPATAPAKQGAAKQAPGKPKPAGSKTAPAKSGKAAPTKPKAKPERDTTNHWGSKDCIRKRPEPTLNTTNPNVVKRTWAVDSTSGWECIRMINGDSLTIQHTGCKEYTLIYHLMAPGATSPPTDKSFWFYRAGLMIFGLKNSDTPFDFDEVSTLLFDLSKKKDSSYNKDYFLYNEEDHSETLNLKEVGALKKGGYLKLKLTLKVNV